MDNYKYLTTIHARTHDISENSTSSTTTSKDNQVNTGINLKTVDDFSPSLISGDLRENSKWCETLVTSRSHINADANLPNLDTQLFPFQHFQSVLPCLLSPNHADLISDANISADELSTLTMNKVNNQKSMFQNYPEFSSLFLPDSLHGSMDTFNSSQTDLAAVAANIQNVHALAGQYLVLQTQQFIAQQLTECCSDVSTDVIGVTSQQMTNVKQIIKTESQKGQDIKDVFVCGIDECHKEYSSLAAVQKHQSCHNKQFSCVCPVVGCTRSFMTSSNLKYHLMTHSGERNFECATDGCTQRFYTKQQLRVHLRSHSRLRLYKCNFNNCTAAFSTAGNLRNHSRIHSGDKPFVCEECGKCFTEKNTLKKHSVIHSGLRAFACDICGRLFTQSSSKRFHMATKHGK